MGYSDSILKAVATISFLLALEASGSPRSVVLVLLVSAIAGFSMSVMSDFIRTVLASRLAMAPWLLSSAAVLAISRTDIAVLIAIVAGALVGSSLTSWQAYNRMVPALGLPMVVSIIAGEGDMSARSVLPWIVVVVDFALLTSHVPFKGTPRSLDHSQTGLVHQPHRALQTIALVVVCIAVASVLSPMVRTPEVDLGFVPAAGDLAGLPLGVHPGLKWGELDTGRRVTLGDEVVLRVKADRPDYWRGITYTSWDGRTWTNPDRGTRYTWPSEGVTLSAGRAGGITSEQHFTLERSGLDVIHGAYKIEALWSTQRAGQVGDDGSITLDKPLGAGAKWTVRSSVIDITPEVLRKADPLTMGISTGMKSQFASEADITPRVEALALEITEDEPTTYDKIRALESWMDDNIKYSRNIATLPDGADAVEQLLLIDQLGYCEQIGTSLVVMLRSLGIPARLVVGYVPGSYDEKTGEWISKASDAHAWAEVFFPGVGWQGFDPTSGVPLSGEDSSVSVASRSGPDLFLILQIGIASAGLLALAFLFSRLLARSDRDTPSRVRRLNRIGSKLEREWIPAMTVREKLDDLARIGIDEDLTRRVAVGLEQVSYGNAADTVHPAVDNGLCDLENAVDHFLKVPR